MLTRPARPTAEDVLVVVREAVAVVLELDPPQVGRDASLEELGADSLVLVEVAEIVEERLSALAGNGFHIPDPDLEGMRTVGEFVDYAVARL